MRVELGICRLGFHLLSSVTIVKSQ